RLGHGLLQPQVLARLDGGHAELEVRAHRRGDGDRVDRGIAQEVVKVRRDPDGREAALEALELRGVEVGDGHDLGVARLDEVPDEVGAPVAVPDDADPDHAAVPFWKEIKAMPAMTTTRPTICRSVSGSRNATTAPAVTRVKVQLTRMGYAMLSGSVATTRNHTMLARK